MNDDEQLQKALEFAREFKKLVEKTGFTISSCGCCPPSLDTVVSRGDSFNHDEVAEDIVYLLDLEEPYDKNVTADQRVAARAKLVESIKAML